MDTKSRWRVTPAPLLIAFGAWLVWVTIRFAMNMSATPDHVRSAKVVLIGEGLSFACQILVLLGTLELAERLSERPRTFVRLALWGVALVIVTDTLVGFLQFTNEPWSHEWVFKAWDYASVIGWNLFAFGLVQSLRPAQRTLGFVALGIAFVAWLPPVLHDPLWKMMKLDGKPLLVVETLLRALRLLALGWLAIAASSSAHETTVNTPLAASGFRLAAKGLWLRVITAFVVVMFTLLLIAGKGQGGLAFFKLVTMAQAIVSVLALLVTGLGGLRVARAGIADLSPLTLTVGGGASLWAAGVSFAQLPYIYKMLYSGEGIARFDDMGFTTALTLALPIVVIAGVGLFVTALSGYAARRGDEDLRGDAQAKGFGFVLLMLAAIAIQNWMLPKATSTGGFVMYALLGAIAGLWATVMVAKLFARGAEVLESEPGLPTASVVATDPT